MPSIGTNLKEKLMSPSTYNMYANEAYIDHGYNFTLADAVDYAEFIEDVNSWEEIVEEI